MHIKQCNRIKHAITQNLHFRWMLYQPQFNYTSIGQERYWYPNRHTYQQDHATDSAKSIMVLNKNVQKKNKLHLTPYYVPQ